MLRRYADTDRAYTNEEYKRDADYAEERGGLLKFLRVLPCYYLISAFNACQSIF